MDIRLKGITKSFHGNMVLRNISLCIESQKLTTLLGVSGCGKTTLLRILAGLEEPDDGEVWFDDVCVYSSERNIDVPPEQRGLGFVFQDFSLWPHMTVFENVAFGLRATKRTNGLAERVMEALRAVRLADFAERYPHQLSGGQQQRVAFARAIAVEPSCILFDEPLSALDALLRDEMRAELRELVASRHITSVFVTHDQMEAMSMSDVIVVMNKGSVLQQGDPESVYRHPADPFVARFIGHSNWLDDRRMVRPEHLSLLPVPESEELVMDVRGVQFAGDAYILQLSNGQLHWTVSTPQRHVVGEKIPIYIRIRDIVGFPKRNSQEKIA